MRGIAAACPAQSRQQQQQWRQHQRHAFPPFTREQRNDGIQTACPPNNRGRCSAAGTTASLVDT
eukprot:256117-Chlamydomonas_euryale.AAC.3